MKKSYTTVYNMNHVLLVTRLFQISIDAGTDPAKLRFILLTRPLRYVNQ